MEQRCIRVAQVIGKWVGGGVEAVVMNYYRHIDHSKVQFDFICDEDSTDIPYEEIEKLGGKVIIVPPYQKIFKYQRALKKVLEEGNYKIIHSHINTLSVFPLRIAKKIGIPVRIAHSHSTTNKKEWKKNLLKQTLRPFSKVYATNYFCCSEYAGRWQFGNKTYDEKKVFLLKNAIEIEKFKYDEEIRKNKRKELNINDDTLVIGNIGRFVSVKNHSNEVHKKNKNSLLLLVGQGPLRGEIERKVEKLDLSKNVIFLGQRSDVNELYQSMDIFALPSLYEGLGMVLLEVQANGLRAITSVFVPKEVNISKEITFKEMSSIYDWVDEIISINTDRTNNTKLLEDAGYDIKIEAEKLEKVYLELNKKV